MSNASNMRTARVAGALALVSAGIASTHTYPVAGVAPNQRPEGTPTITSATLPTTALHGVLDPPPESIGKFIKDQGNWYTPFFHPGMTGPYDIRDWHSNPPPPVKR